MFISGRAFGFTLVGVIPAAVAPHAWVAWAWLGLTAALCLLDALLAPSPRSVAVRREATDTLRLTESGASVLTLLNMGERRASGIARDAWEPSAGAGDNRHPFALDVGQSVKFVTTLTPTRRGERASGAVTLRLNGPFRLAGRQLSVPAAAVVRVLPEFASRKHLPSRLARLRELDGRSAVQIRGAGSEFDSLREYVIGDDVRSIDWRATARRNDVVVRTWRPERDRHVVILLDTSRTSAARIGDAPRLDASIEAALLLAALATHAGDRVEVLAYDRQVRARVSGETGAGLIASMARKFAGLQPRLVEADWVGAVHELRQRTSQRALVVVLSALDPAAAESGLLRAMAPLARKHQVVVASVSDPEHDALRLQRGSTAAIYNAAAATRVDLERMAMAVWLRSRGAEVVDASPDEFAPAVSDIYLALKAAGRL